MIILTSSNKNCNVCNTVAVFTRCSGIIHCAACNTSCVIRSLPWSVQGVNAFTSIYGQPTRSLYRGISDRSIMVYYTYGDSIQKNDHFNMAETTKHAAQRLGISVRTVQRRLKNGWTPPPRPRARVWVAPPPVFPAIRVIQVDGRIRFEVPIGIGIEIVVMPL